MTQIPFVTAEIAFAAVWLMLRAAVWIRQKKIEWKREAVLLLMFVNLAVILRVVFFPMAHTDGRVQPLVFDAASLRPLRVNLIPFVHLLWFDTRRDLLLNLIGNVALFIPSGIVLPVVYKCLNSFWKVLGVGALMSLCIELMQLPFSARASDVDDLILNTLGVAIGYGIWALFRLLKRGRAKKQPDPAE